MVKRVFKFDTYYFLQKKQTLSYMIVAYSNLFPMIHIFAIMNRCNIGCVTFFFLEDLSLDQIIRFSFSRDTNMPRQNHLIYLHNVSYNTGLDSVKLFYLVRQMLFLLIKQLTLIVLLRISC